ncbi:MAG: LysM peptidoglycan-binding domain-containing protein [Gammaproteobacteria bacterium]
MSLLTRRHCQAIMLLLASAGCAAPPLPEPPPPVQQIVIVPEPPPLVSYTIVARLEAGLLPTVPEVPMRQPDLLSQLATELQFEHIQRPDIDVQRTWYARHPDYLNRVFERGAPYLPYITRELERRGMPADLALLPIVESAYDPFAYSHGRAAGLWQMIPGTASRFGIKQNWWYDGRRDVLDSTRAALDYLQFLHDRFDGDWLLAIAGYNSGEGNVSRAIRRNRAAGKPIDFWNLRLPRETSAYVPKLLALSQLVADPGAFGLSLPEIDDEEYFVSLGLDGQMDLALLAELAGITLDQFYALNPGYNRWATDPDGPHRAIVPRAAGPQLAEAVDALPSSERMRWVRYRIRSGDSLITIADRHDTTPGVIRDVNEISGNTIRAGDYLMIPTATRQLSAYSQSAESRLARTQSKPRGNTKVSHTVQSGDSLWSIARRYGVRTRSLAKWNGMAPGDTLSVGRALVVWTSEDVSSTPATSPADRTRKIRYTVRRGDSLYKIAQRFRVTIDQIKRWNKLAGSKYLQPGQKLTMYVDVTSQSS